MNNVLIVGIEGAVGAGLASVLRQSHAVVGLANRAGINVAGCRVVHAVGFDAVSIQQHLQSERPDWVIFCGAASRSSWDSHAVHQSAINDSHAIEWAKAAGDAESHRHRCLQISCTELAYREQRLAGIGEVTKEPECPE